MAHKYKVVDTKFNQANYPDLIGQILDKPPAYANVQLVQDRPSMADIFKYQSKWLDESIGDTSLENFVIKCFKAGYEKDEIIEGLGEFFRQAPEPANNIFNRAIMMLKKLGPYADKKSSSNNWYKKAMNWHKESQFTERIDEDLLKDFVYKGKEKTQLDPTDDFILPKDEDLKYFEDALNQPVGKVLNDEERARLMEKIREEKGVGAMELERERRAIDISTKLGELRQDWLLNRYFHKDDPTFSDPSLSEFIRDKGYGKLLSAVSKRE